MAYTADSKTRIQETIPRIDLFYNFSYETESKEEDGIEFICYPTKCVYCNKESVEMSDDGNQYQTCEDCGKFFAPDFYTIINGKPVLKNMVIKPEERKMTIKPKEQNVNLENILDHLKRIDNNDVKDKFLTFPSSIKLNTYTSISNTSSITEYYKQLSNKYRLNIDKCVDLVHHFSVQVYPSEVLTRARLFIAVPIPKDKSLFKKWFDQTITLPETETTLVYMPVKTILNPDYTSFSFFDYPISVVHIPFKLSIQVDIEHERVDNRKRWVKMESFLLGTDYLVAQGADVRVANQYAVQYASSNGHLEVVKFLVSQGADIRADDDWAVRNASQFGHFEVVKYLVSQGADVRACDDFAVRWASRNNHLEVVMYLVSQGADVRAKDDFAVQLASSNGYLELVKYLVSQGADVQANDDWSVKLASHYGHREVVKYLVCQGASTTKISEKTLL